MIAMSLARSEGVVNKDPQIHCLKVRGGGLTHRESCSDFFLTQLAVRLHVFVQVLAMRTLGTPR